MLEGFLLYFYYVYYVYLCFRVVTKTRKKGPHLNLRMSKQDYQVWLNSYKKLFKNRFH